MYGMSSSKISLKKSAQLDRGQVIDPWDFGETRTSSTFIISMF